MGKVDISTYEYLTDADSDGKLYGRKNGSWTEVVLSEVIAHGDLTDMPDVGGTNTDHDARYLTLDQTTPQTVINGIPIFSAGLAAGSTSQLGIDVSGNLTTTGTLISGTHTPNSAFDSLGTFANPWVNGWFTNLAGTNVLTNSYLAYDGTGLFAWDGFEIDVSQDMNLGANNLTTTGIIAGSDFVGNVRTNLITNTDGGYTFFTWDLGNLEIDVGQDLNLGTNTIGLGSVKGNISFTDAATDLIEINNANLDMNSNDIVACDDIALNTINDTNDASVTLFRNVAIGSGVDGKYLQLYRNTATLDLYVDQYSRGYIFSPAGDLVLYAKNNSANNVRIGNAAGGEFFLGGNGAVSKCYASYNDMDFGWTRSASPWSHYIKFSGTNIDGNFTYFQVEGGATSRMTTFKSERTIFEGQTINKPQATQNITAVTDIIKANAGTVVLNPNADYILTSTSTIEFGGFIIENCEDAWNEQTITYVTASADTGDKKVGSASAKFVLTADFTTGTIGSEAVNNVDIRQYNVLYAWVKSSVALNANDWQIGVSETANMGGSPTWINIPALSAATWTRVRIPITTTNLNAVISIGLKQVVDKGAMDFWIDDVTVANESTGQTVNIITANTEANTVTVQSEGTLAGSNLRLGAATRTIKAKAILGLMYDGTEWLEQAYVDSSAY